MRQFKFDWFDNNIPLFNNFLQNFKNKDNLNFLEIGSFEGKSTCWLLDNILTGNNCSITCIDSWEGGFEHSELNFDEIFLNFKNNTYSSNEKIKILKGSSYEKLIEIQSQKLHFDFIYIDGGHTAKNVIQDSILCFELLKNGGVMAFDDYIWGFNQLPLKQIPKQSIDTFLMAYEDDIHVLNKSNQVWIVKK